MRNEITDPSRRKFIRNTVLAAVMSPFVKSELFAGDKIPKVDRLKVHIFSKHLQFLDYKDLAAAAKEMGFDGVDLTVRPNGHVLPERVEDDLPKIAEELKKAGVPPSLMTTAVNDAG